MLLVTVELLSARTGKRTTLAQAEIYNDGKGDHPHRGNYVAKIYRKGSKTRVWKATEIKDFPRLRLNSWDLLYRCLREIVGSRNK